MEGSRTGQPPPLRFYGNKHFIFYIICGSVVHVYPNPTPQHISYMSLHLYHPHDLYVSVLSDLIFWPCLQINKPRPNCISPPQTHINWLSW